MLVFHSAGDILEHALNFGAAGGKGAKLPDIQKCSDRLKKMGFSEIPADYKDFLSMANGFSWREFEFYGTEKLPCEDGDVDDIVSVNEMLRRDGTADLTGMLVIGMATGMYFVYDEKRKLYTEMDLLEFFEPDEEKGTYKNFADLFEVQYLYVRDQDDGILDMLDDDVHSDEKETSSGRSTPQNAGTGAVKNPPRRETPRAAVGRFQTFLDSKDAERGGYASLYDALMASDKNRAPSIMDERLNRYVPDVARIREIEDRYVKGQTILYAHGSVAIGRVPGSNIKVSWLTKLMSEKKLDRRGHTKIRFKMLIITDEYLMGIGNPKYERAEEDVFLRWSEIDRVDGVYRKKITEDSQIQVKLKDGDYVLFYIGFYSKNFTLFKDWLTRLLTCEEAQ